MQTGVMAHSPADRRLRPGDPHEHQDAAATTTGSACWSPPTWTSSPGYRRYTTDQIPTAQVIRRFRELDMPIEEIRERPGRAGRRDPQRAHRRPSGRLEEGLTRTQNAVASLRDLLDRPPPPGTGRHQPPRRGRDPGRRDQRAVVDIEDTAPGTRARSASSTPRSSAQDLSRRWRPAAASTPTSCSPSERGEATVFIPCTGPVRPVGRVEAAGRAARRAGDHRPRRARTTASTAPTARWPPTSPSTRSPWTGRSASTT